MTFSRNSVNSFASGIKGSVPVSAQILDEEMKVIVTWMRDSDRVLGERLGLGPKKIPNTVSCRWDACHLTHQLVDTLCVNLSMHVFFAQNVDVRKKWMTYLSRMAGLTKRYSQASLRRL